MTRRSIGVLVVRDGQAVADLAACPHRVDRDRVGCDVKRRIAGVLGADVIIRLAPRPASAPARAGRRLRVRIGNGNLRGYQLLVPSSDRLPGQHLQQRDKQAPVAVISTCTLCCPDMSMVHTAEDDRRDPRRIHHCCRSCRPSRRHLFDVFFFASSSLQAGGLASRAAQNQAPPGPRPRPRSASRTSPARWSVHPSKPRPTAFRDRCPRRFLFRLDTTTEQHMIGTPPQSQAEQHRLRVRRTAGAWFSSGQQVPRNSDTVESRSQISGTASARRRRAHRQRAEHEH